MQAFCCCLSHSLWHPSDQRVTRGHCQRPPEAHSIMPLPQVAAERLAAAATRLQHLSACLWLNRAWLVEAMAVFPLLLMVCKS